MVSVPKDEKLSLSNGWLEKFKKRNRLKEYKWHGEAASATSEAVKQERKWIMELITKYGYELKDIFNMNETKLFYGYVTFLTICTKALVIDGHCCTVGWL